MCEELHTEETRTATPRTSRPTTTLATGEQVGRFSVLSEVGAGGMGRVYEAYDPKLDRRVALKLLRETSDAEHRQRLMREAQALARLDHPNVVTVHDVGIHDGRLFVAMEFVSGGTLKDWLTKNPPAADPDRFDAAMRLLIDAGRGLVAAHQAGLVHRDVKPSNILVGNDGRARVADFGIARPLESPAARSLTSTNSSDPLRTTDDSGSKLTRTGAVVGTPAYMAPEQLSNGRVEAATDQFSYCVTAWEVLFGARPFAATAARSRRSAIRKGELDVPPGGAVPPSVAELLRRGLRLRPSARHRGMEVLVDGLAHATRSGHARNSSRWRRGLAFVLLGSISTFGVYRAARTSQLCTGAKAEFDKIWNENQRARLERAAVSAEAEVGKDIWPGIEARLDEYGDDWRREYTDACEATRVRHEHSPERMAQRLDCLDGAKLSAGALIRRLRAAEADVFMHHEELLDNLPKPAACAAEREGLTTAELVILDTVARAIESREQGLLRQALTTLEGASARLDGNTPPAVAAIVQLEYGRALRNTSRSQALRQLERSYSLAHGAGKWRLAGVAAREVAELYSLPPSQPERVRTWLERGIAASPAHSATERYKDLFLDGWLVAERGEKKEAGLMFDRAVEAASTDSRTRPHALRQRARMLQHERPADALRDARAALDAYRDECGASHPGIAEFEETVAAVLSCTGEDGEAIKLAERARQRAAEVWGEGHVGTNPYDLRLAALYCAADLDPDKGQRLASDALGRLPEGTPTHERHAALEVLLQCTRSLDPEVSRRVASDLVRASESLYGGEHLRTVEAITSLAAAQLRVSDIASSRDNLRLASTLLARDRPQRPAPTARHIHALLGELANEHGETSMALRHARAALALRNDAEPASREDRAQHWADACFSTYIAESRSEALLCCERAAELSSSTSLEHRARLELKLGELLNLDGKSADALDHMSRAANFFRDRLPESAYYTAVSEVGLAHIYENLGQHSNAEFQFRQSFRRFDEFDSAGFSSVESGAGIARMTARGGAPTEGLLLLDGLEKQARPRSTIDRAIIAVSRGYIRNIVNAGDGREDYEHALELHRVREDFTSIEDVCKKAPFSLPTCDAIQFNSPSSFQARKAR